LGFEEEEKFSCRDEKKGVFIDGHSSAQGLGYMTRRLIVFGTGAFARRTLPRLQRGYEVVGFVDNNKMKQGKRFLGLEVIEPTKQLFESVDAIFIASSYTESIYNQLIDLGVPPEKILVDGDIRLVRILKFCIENIIVIIFFALLGLGFLKLWELIDLFWI
jgi:hypothetical protein